MCQTAVERLQLTGCNDRTTRESEGLGIAISGLAIALFQRHMLRWNHQCDCNSPIVDANPLDDGMPDVKPQDSRQCRRREGSCDNRIDSTLPRRPRAIHENGFAGTKGITGWSCAGCKPGWIAHRHISIRPTMIPVPKFECPLAAASSFQRVICARAVSPGVDMAPQD